MEDTVVDQEESVGQRILLTYCLAGVAAGLCLIAFLALLMAGLGGASVMGLFVLLPLVGVGVVLVGTRVLRLGWGSAAGVALMPLPPLALSPAEPSWQVMALAALALPAVVVLALESRFRWAAGVVVIAVAVVVVSLAGVGPLASGSHEDRLVEDLQAQEIEVFAPQSGQGPAPKAVHVEDEVLTYEVEAADATHRVEVARRPAGDEPIEGLPRGWTAKGEGVRYEQGMLITVESRKATGARDLAAAIKFAERLEWTSPRDFAQEADL